MPISNLVESAVNLAENVTGADIDRDGDIGVRGTSAEKQRDDEVTTKSIQEKSTGIFGLQDLKPTLQRYPAKPMASGGTGPELLHADETTVPPEGMYWVQMQGLWALRPIDDLDQNRERESGSQPTERPARSALEQQRASLSDADRQWLSQSAGAACSAAALSEASAPPEGAGSSRPERLPRTQGVVEFHHQHCSPSFAAAVAQDTASRLLPQPFTQPQPAPLPAPQPQDAPESFPQDWPDWLLQWGRRVEDDNGPDHVPGPSASPSAPPSPPGTPRRKDILSWLVGSPHLQSVRVLSGERHTYCVPYTRATLTVHE